MLLGDVVMIINDCWDVVSSSRDAVLSSRVTVMLLGDHRGVPCRHRGRL